MDDQTPIPSDDDIIARQQRITSGNVQPPVASGLPPPPSDADIITRQRTLMPDPPTTPAPPEPAKPDSADYIWGLAKRGFASFGNNLAAGDAAELGSLPGAAPPTQASLTVPTQAQANTALFGKPTVVAPNWPSRYAGAVAEGITSNPILAASAPVATVGSSLGSQAGADVFPNSSVAPFIGGLLGGSVPALAMGGANALTGGLGYRFKPSAQQPLPSNLGDTAEARASVYYPPKAATAPATAPDATPQQLSLPLSTPGNGTATPPQLSLPLSTPGNGTPSRAIPSERGFRWEDVPTRNPDGSLTYPSHIQTNPDGSLTYAAPPVVNSPDAPPLNSGGPQPAGAQVTPSNLAVMAQKDQIAARLTHEQNLRDEPPNARANGQGMDTTEYVPGSIPTQAEYSGDASTSLRQKADLQFPDQASRWDARDNANNDARIALFKQEQGSPTTTQNLKNQISDKFAPQYQKLWDNQTPTDAQPAQDYINQTLNSPDGKNTAVTNALTGVEAKLHVGNDPTAPLETNPDQLFGARQEVARLMGATAKRANPDLGDPRVTAHLGQLKDTIDGIIEGGAPGYQAVQRDYATAMQPVDKQNLLQSFAPDLMDAKNHMTLNRVQDMMEKIVDQRGAPGANQAKSLTDQDMGKLWDLRNDLARRGNIDLGKARGSDTVQTGLMNNILQNYGRDAALHIATIPAHIALNSLMGGDPIANYIGAGLQSGLQGVKLMTKKASDAAKIVEQRSSRIDAAMAPPPGWPTSP